MKKKKNLLPNSTPRDCHRRIIASFIHFSFIYSARPPAVAAARTATGVPVAAVAYPAPQTRTPQYGYGAPAPAAPATAYPPAVCYTLDILLAKAYCVNINSSVALFHLQGGAYASPGKQVFNNVMPSTAMGTPVCCSIYSALF